jgi:hypothetical protein
LRKVLTLASVSTIDILITVALIRKSALELIQFNAAALLRLRQSACWACHTPQ